MSKLKSLKNKVASKVRDRFKKQNLNPDEEEKKQAQEEESEELDSDDDFFVEPPEVGDQFMACKPWLGAIK